jgi:hypothetical protein
MRAYDIALFIHLLGAITFFIAIGIMQRGGARVRGAQTVEHLRLWLGLVQTTQRMFPSAIVMLLGAGVYMTIDVWTFETPWVMVSLVALVTMTAVGTGIVGRRFSRIEAAAKAAGDGSLPPQLGGLIAEPITWGSLSALNGAAIGIVWLMATKPGWAVSISVVLGLALIGALIGLALARRDRQQSAVRSKGETRTN